MIIGDACPGPLTDPARTLLLAHEPGVWAYLSQVFGPLTTGWRPTGPTLMFVTNEDALQTLIAVPFGPNGRTGEPVRL